MLIYKVTNIKNSKCYIGQTTTSLKKRRKDHENSWSCKYCTPFDRLLHEEGKDNFIWEIIEDNIQSFHELNEKEKYYIKKFDSFNNGYNNTNGGSTNFVLSEESKKLISEKQKGDKNHMYGKTGSQNPYSKRILNVTDGIIYSSGTDCAKNENIPNSCISKLYAVCRGERKTVLNKVYRYIDENDNIISDYYNDNIIYNLTTNKQYHFYKEIKNHYSNYLCLKKQLQKIKNKNKQFAIYNNEIWAFSKNIEIKTENSINPRNKIILNVTNNEYFVSLRLASLSIGSTVENSRNLATKLRKNNNHCMWNGYEWIIL